MGSDCTLCPLHKTAQSVCLPGVGAQAPRLLIVSDSPTYESDAANKGFSDKDSELLKGVLEGLNLLHITRMTHVVRCRVPGDKKPNKESIAACRDFLEKEISTCPTIEVIVPMGPIAQKAFDLNGPTLKLAGVPALWSPSTPGSPEYTVIPLAKPGYVRHRPAYASVWQSGWGVVTSMLQDEPTDYLARIGAVYTDQLFPVPGLKALDLETTGLDPNRDNFTSVTVSSGHVTCAKMVEEPSDLLAIAEYMSGEVVVHSSAFEQRWAAVLGVKPTKVYDTQLIGYRYEPGNPMTLDAMTTRHVPDLAGYKSETESLLAKGVTWDNMPKGPLLRRNACDGWGTWQLKATLWPRLTQAERDAHDEDVAICRAVEQAASKGVWLDKEAMLEVKAECEGKMEQALAGLPEGLNPRSAPQVGEWLTKLGVRLPTSDKGNVKTGEIPLRVAAMESGEETRQKFQRIFDYRGAAHTISTYIKGYASRLDADGYLRSDMRWPGTITWRPSSSNPNLLNVVKSNLRRIFAAPPGYVFFEADYSQAELRIAAALSKDPMLVQVYRDDGDLHRQTAVALFGKTNISDAERKTGKTVNFGTIYGGGVNVLWHQFLKADVWIEQEVVAQYRRKFWETYHVLDSFLQGEMQKVRRGEYLYAPTGAYRWKLDNFLLTEKDEESAARGVVNATIQSVPPRMIGRAMIQMEKEGLGDVRIHTYDGMVGYLPVETAREDALRIKEIMEEQTREAWWGEVPCVADVKIGPNWANLEEVKDAD